MSNIENCNLCQCATSDLVFRKNGFDLVRCKNCGLLYIINPPNETQIKKLYSFESNYHEDLTSSAKSIDFRFSRAKKNLRILTEHIRPSQLLDIGCSTGLFLVAARESGWTVNGLEFSPDSARLAREKYGLDVKQGELRNDSYPTDSFNVVTMWDVIEHLPDPRKALEIVLGVLSNDGLLILKTPNADGLYPKLSLAVAHLVNHWSHPEPPAHLYQFSEATLSHMLDISGFDIIQVYHKRIPIQYSFGKFSRWFCSFKWLLYSLTFAPFAILGPWLRKGDDITIVARKRN